MRPLYTFTVASAFPPELERLHDLVFNLYWSWEPRIAACFRAIDAELWHRTNHHPLKLLQQVPVERMHELAADERFLAVYRDAVAALDDYLSAPTWHGASRGGSKDVIAYFSAEFGLHESLPLYSGGLGVLSGDHTKSASDLGLPLIGVGLLYQMGYFQQRITVEGIQLESYEFNDPSILPITEVLDEQGRPLRVTVDFPDAQVAIGVWSLVVGRVTLYLLDTNLRENRIPRYRDIADYLYGGDQETRIMQEIVLGIGGIRALQAMGIEPTVTHMNEGHSAFLMLERIRTLMLQHKIGFDVARQIASDGAAFTTHTPVPAGHDAFPREMIDRYFSAYWPTLGLSRDEFHRLGTVGNAGEDERFSMTVLALRLASRHNGVSMLHAAVSRDMWQGLWPQLPPEECPIVGITNGIHTRTWLAAEMAELFDGYLPSDWRGRTGDSEVWSHATKIPVDELWETTNRLRRDLIDAVRRRIDERHVEIYTRSSTGRDIGSVLDPDALTIGFARRFATYKRATLLFRDRERVLRLFNDPDRPLQMVIAGKAHPKDMPGKDLIREIHQTIAELGLEGRIVFLEDYDMAVARSMVQGCDVWLNTPRRPLEASGTSGMKAAVNGTLNLSILDGWFPEAYDGTNGFAIGGERQFADADHQDEYESRQLYRTLEQLVIPRFYERDADGIPNAWVAMQINALRTIGGRFSAHRMVQQYANGFYFPCSDRFTTLSSNGARAAGDLVAWRNHVVHHWSGVEIVSVSTDASGHMQTGQEVAVRARVRLGSLGAEDVLVEAWSGGLDPDNQIVDGRPTALIAGEEHDGMVEFSGSITLERPRRTGVTVRVIPWKKELGVKFGLNLIAWAHGEISTHATTA